MSLCCLAKVLFLKKKEKRKKKKDYFSDLLLLNKFQQMFNLFHLSLKLSGFPIEKAQADFEKILQISEADYPDYLEN